MTQRGDVALVHIPFVSAAPGGKNRPVVVIQCDRNNQRLRTTLVTGITSRLHNVREATQFLIDPATPEGSTSGLKQASAVKCENLFTIDQKDVYLTIGHLSAVHLTKLEECLKASLALS